ncbi:hypothetical protein HAX54_028828 [Datura stramonium]|uniref:Uncharacterized protein n=1 Tax=Datura stramonium TaxID=4076 RepID=A0ABS8S9X2_DATST|nr:hypothetical protein [Datura stramonium]
MALTKTPKSIPRPPQKEAFFDLHLSCAGKAQSQSQGTVKLHRIVMPFVWVGTYPTRNFATLEDGCAPAHSRMGWQCSVGKIVLILDAVHWNPEAPPRTLPRVRLRCGKAPPYCASSQLRRVSLVVLLNLELHVKKGPR